MRQVLAMQQVLVFITWLAVMALPAATPHRPANVSSEISELQPSLTRIWSRQCSPQTSKPSLQPPAAAGAQLQHRFLGHRPGILFGKHDRRSPETKGSAFSNVPSVERIKFDPLCRPGSGKVHGTALQPFREKFPGCQLKKPGSPGADRCHPRSHAPGTCPSRSALTANVSSPDPYEVQRPRKQRQNT